MINSLNHPIFYALIMTIAGIGIPVMAAMNAGMSNKVNSPIFATLILLVSGFIAATILITFLRNPIVSPFQASAPYYYYFSGFLFVFYITTIAWIAPKFGIGNAIAFVLLGQLLSMTIIDHFSLFGSPHYPITWQRCFGLIMMMIGIFLVVKKA